MRRLALVVGMLVAAGSSAQGYVVQVDGPFDVLRNANKSWSFELVTGPSLDQLTPVTADPIDCVIKDVTSTTSKLVCSSNTGKSPKLAALVLGTRELVFEGEGVRELRGAATKDAIADAGNALALTFTGQLTTSTQKSLQGSTGSKANFKYSTARYSIEGVERAALVSEATSTPAATTGTPKPVAEQTAAVYAPENGPVILCRVRAKETPAYVCLRRVSATLVTQAKPDPADPVADPANPPKKKTASVSLARKKTRLTTTLTPAAVAKKVTSAYLSGIKRCYTTTLKTKPSTTGTLALVFTVNAVGKTEKISAKSPDEKLTTCVTGNMKSWRFAIPQSEYGSPIAAVYELDFKLALK
jgi:hypothetical protein